MFDRKFVAVAAAVLMGATLVDTAFAYPTTARKGTSTVTGVYRPLVLDLDVVQTVPQEFADCEGPCSSSVYFEEGYGGPSDAWYEPAYINISLFMTGTYETIGDSSPSTGALTGNAGYWEYSYNAEDGDGGVGITSSQISESEFEILISADNVGTQVGFGTQVGSLTYLGGGSFGGVPYEDKPQLGDDERGNDWFQYFTTMAGAVMRITSSNSSGDDFVLSFQQDIKHLGPFGSPLDVARTNTACFDSDDEPIPCGNVTLTAAAAAVPEPASLTLVGLGLLGLAWGRRQKRSRLRIA